MKEQEKPSKSVEPKTEETTTVKNQKDFMAAAMLSLFLGWFGIDRFYLGYVGSGILKLITFGGCGLWYLIDLILILTGSLKSADKQELKDRSKNLKTALIITAIVFAIGFIGSIASGSSKTNQQGSQTKQEVTTKTETKTEAVAFETKTVDDNTVNKGETKVDPEGQNGEKTITYEVTYTNGQETSRKQISEAITKQPVTKVIHNGTYVAPPPPTTQSGGVRVGAICVDGTHSNATGSGACSHHGGVDHWLYN